VRGGSQPTSVRKKNPNIILSTSPRRTAQGKIKKGLSALHTFLVDIGNRRMPKKRERERERRRKANARRKYMQ